MRLREFAYPVSEGPEDEADQWSSLVTTLELLKRQGKSRGIPVKYNLSAFLRLIQNSGPNDPTLSSFSYAMLNQAREESDEVKSLIDFNDQEVTIKVSGDEDMGGSGEESGGNENTVANMAKSALKKRT